MVYYGLFWCGGDKDVYCIQWIEKKLIFLGQYPKIMV